MSFLQMLLGKSKVRRKEAYRLFATAAEKVEQMLNENEVKQVFDATEAFYAESAMWPSGFKTIDEFQIYLIVFAKSMCIFFKETFYDKFNSDELVSLSQSAVLTEVGVLLNNQKKNPNSNIALLLTEIIVGQKLATQSSLAILIDSPEVFKQEKERLQDMISFLASGKTMQVKKMLE